MENSGQNGDNPLSQGDPVMEVLPSYSEQTTNTQAMSQAAPSNQNGANQGGVKPETEKAVNEVQQQQPALAAEDSTTTTVQFIAVSAEEHSRMVAQGELPESVHGADVYMQIANSESQRVRLIAVDSTGLPVTDYGILHAAAEQASIIFLLKTETGGTRQITIDEAMQLSLRENPPMITVSTASAIVQDSNNTEETNQINDSDGESDDEAAGSSKGNKRTLKLRVYSQKEEPTASHISEMGTAFVEDPALMAGVDQAEDKPNDESVYEFQDPPTGGETGEQQAVEVFDPTFFKTSGKRTTDKNRDRRKIYQCRECAFYSHRHGNLIRHMKIHTDERPYKCHLCERSFRTNTLLRNHINTHTGVKPYKCTVDGCEMAFVTSGELTRHTRYIHTHEKPFRCTLCDYASVEISKLRRHFRSHTGERPYACEECGKAFADSFHLKRHRMSHTGEKPYECPECNQRFTQRGSVKMHIQQQHTKTAPKFRCEICKTLLGRKSDLNVHMRKQHAFQETPLQCRYCDELFHDRWSLMQHQRTHRSSTRNNFKNDDMVMDTPRRKRGPSTSSNNPVEWEEQNLHDGEYLLEMDQSENGHDQVVNQLTVYVQRDDEVEDEVSAATTAVSSATNARVVASGASSSKNDDEQPFAQLQTVSSTGIKST